MQTQRKTSPLHELKDRKASQAHFEEEHRATKKKEDLLHEAGMGKARQGYQCWESILIPLPLDKGLLCPGTEMRVLTGARKGTCQ